MTTVLDSQTLKSLSVHARVRSCSYWWQEVTEHVEPGDTVRDLVEGQPPHVQRGVRAFLRSAGVQC